MIGQRKFLIAWVMVNDEDVKPHIEKVERCQRHPRPRSSSPISFDEGFLRAWISQTRTQRPQPCQRHQQHQRLHLRPPHLTLCLPLCRSQRPLRLVSLDLEQDSPRLSLHQHFFEDIKRGRGNSGLNSWLIVRLGRTNFPKQTKLSSGHASSSFRRTWLIS